MSDTVWPHRRQPARPHHPWDSPGKNTGVGCHFLLQCIKVKSESEVAQSCPTLSDPMDCRLPGSSIHGIFQATVLEWGAIAFSSGFPFFPHLFAMKWRDQTPWSSFFWILSFKSAFSLSSFTFIKSLFSASSLSAIKVVSCAYLRLSIFLLEILIPLCETPNSDLNWRNWGKPLDHSGMT